MKLFRVWAFLLAAVLLATVPLVGCRSAYYKAYEEFGVYKRDLLKKRVVATRDEEKAAGAQFQDALQRLKAITGFQGGDLEAEYNQLKAQYDGCAARATTVHERIKSMDQVAEDLFTEWTKENAEISTPTLRARSEDQLVTTREKYTEMADNLKRAEASMTPVLRQFNDYVLYLKHDLNAAAVASLKGEAMNIQADIQRLIDEMNRSIAHADEFIKAMP